MHVAVNEQAHYSLARSKFVVLKQRCIRPFLCKRFDQIPHYTDM